MDPNYSEAAASLFIWIAEKALGSAKKVLAWGWSHAQWIAAQDRYDAEILKQYGSIHIFGQSTPKPLRDIFTDVYVLGGPTSYRRITSDELTNHLWNEDRGISFRHGERRPIEELLSTGIRFFILGKPGAGKTTLLKYMAVREAERGRWGATINKLPVFISLKQFSSSGKSLHDFILDQFTVCQFPDAAPFVEGLLKSGNALLLFDGLDEVTRIESPRGNRRGQVAEELTTFAKNYSKCHVIITCRNAAIDFTFEKFTYLEMADFAPDQVEKFVRAWFWEDENRDASATIAFRMLEEWAKPEHEGIRDLARNPLLLTLLCLNYAETQSFPNRRAEIYEEALDALLKKWDSTRQIQRGGMYRSLSLGRKRQMFAQIAFEAFERNQILFQQTRLEASIQSYLKFLPEMPNPVDIDTDALLQEIIAQHGIFAQQAHRLYSFSHLTFQEYFAAQYVADDTSSAALRTLLSHAHDEKWREVMLLASSLLPDATDLLEGFADSLLELAASNMAIVSVLQQINRAAEHSRAGYRLSATRLFYLHQARETIDKIGYGIDRSWDSIYGNLLGIDRDLSLDAGFALELNELRNIVRRRHRNKYDEVTNRITRLAARATNEKREDLSHALASVEMPNVNGGIDEWMLLARKLEEAALLDARLLRFRKLEDEAKSLVASQQISPLHSSTEGRLLAEYLKATSLYYDCIKIAYTPRRFALEERILATSRPIAK